MIEAQFTLGFAVLFVSIIERSCSPALRSLPDQVWSRGSLAHPLKPLPGQQGLNPLQEGPSWPLARYSCPLTHHHPGSLLPLLLSLIGGPVCVVLHAPVIGRSCSPALCSRPGQFWPCEALARPWDSSLAFKANLARYSAPVELLSDPVVIGLGEILLAALRAPGLSAPGLPCV